MFMKSDHIPLLMNSVDSPLKKGTTKEVPSAKECRNSPPNVIRDFGCARFVACSPHLDQDNVVIALIQECDFIGSVHRL